MASSKALAKERAFVSFSRASASARSRSSAYLEDIVFSSANSWKRNNDGTIRFPNDMSGYLEWLSLQVSPMKQYEHLVQVSHQFQIWVRMKG